MKLLVSACLTCVCLNSGLAVSEPAEGRPPAVNAELRLSTLVDFPIGVAVPADPWPNSLLQSPERQALVDRHFNSITAENIMKMGYLQPARGEFAFDNADALVAYARQHDMIVHGHALVWHNQAPDWMNEFEGTREQFVAILTEHVRTVASHFAGRLESWDVVNEAFTDEVPTKYRKTIWHDNIGPGYIELAFKLAREADPHADLYYNDYDISGALGPAKLDRILEMADDFRGRDIPLDGIGFQMHIDTGEPALADIREAFAKVVERDIKVRISELDISMNPAKRFTEFNPDLAERQRQHYADVARVYIQTVPPRLRGGITVWGITDGDSWIPGFKNRPDWPLLFDDRFRPKKALFGMAEGLSTPQR